MTPGAAGRGGDGEPEQPIPGAPAESSVKRQPGDILFQSPRIRPGQIINPEDYRTPEGGLTAAYEQAKMAAGGGEGLFTPQGARRLTEAYLGG